MKNHIKIILVLLFIISFINNSYCHSGRTDSSGGHRDNKNASGLGGYHYHCGGHPAHLHTNGACPYNTNSVSTYSNNSSNSNNTQSDFFKTIEVESIEIDDKIQKISPESTIKLGAKVLPEDATDKNITWKVNDSNIASIESDGTLKTKKSGDVIITATTSNGKKASITIKVKIEPDEIKITKQITEIIVGDKVLLTTSVTPYNSEYYLKWFSSNENIISVDDKGNIQGVKPGQATIKVTTNNDKTDSIVITVKEKEKEETNGVLDGLFCFCDVQAIIGIVFLVYYIVKVI